MANDPLQLLSGFTKGLEGFAQATQYGALATGYEQRADLMDIQGQQVIASADYAARRQREQADRFMANQVARYSKAGVKFTGSPALVWAESERNLRLDILATKINAATKANEIGFEALNQRLAAGQARYNQKMARTKAIVDIGTGIVNFATSGMGGSNVKVPSSGGGGSYGSISSMSNADYASAWANRGY